MKKKNPEGGGIRRLRSALGRIPGEKRVTILVLSATFAAALAILMFGNTMMPASGTLKVSDYQEGMVADKDVVIDQGITYIDEEATRLKQEAEVKLIPPVFVVRDGITEQVMNEYDRFGEELSSLLEDDIDQEVVFLEIQSALPGLFSREDVETLLSCMENEEVIDQTGVILRNLMVEGILSLTESTKTDTIEIIRWRNGVKEREEKKTSRALTPA